MGLTDNIAKFIITATYEDFPSQAVFAARHGIIDCVACALAGSKEELSNVLVRFAEDTGSGSAATIIGRGIKTSEPMAALVNGAMSHALDYDDITHAIKGHPSVVCLPPALAIGEAVGASGRDVMLAYMVAFEVGCAIASGMGVDYADDLGWHPTAPLGTLAAAVAASRLLGLNQEQTAMAISLAASNASGLRENFGTMTKPFHAGNASRGGVTAAMLVKRGYTAATTGLEGRFGFMHAFSGGRGENVSAPLERLGKQFFLEQPGVNIKKYPCCGSTHNPLDAYFLLRQEQPVDYREVDSVEVFVDFDPPRSLIHSDPHTALEGKFSIQYCLAAALVDGTVGLAQFEDAMVMRPEIRALIPKITMKRNPGNEGKPSWVEAYNEVRITLKNGKVLSRAQHRNYEGSVRGVTPEGMDMKFRDCASRALPMSKVNEALAILHNLEKQPNINGLMSAVSGK
ncbi:MAG: MmgE/PrpD family protein [Pseudomonadota bacterium]